MLTSTAFWLMHAAIPEGHAHAHAEFHTLGMERLKIAARVVEHATRVRAPSQRAVRKSQSSAASRNGDDSLGMGASIHRRPRPNGAAAPKGDACQADRSSAPDA